MLKLRKCKKKDIYLKNKLLNQFKKKYDYSKEKYKKKKKSTQKKFEQTKKEQNFRKTKFQRNVMMAQA